MPSVEAEQVTASQLDETQLHGDDTSTSYVEQPLEQERTQLSMHSRCYLLPVIGSRLLM